MTRTICHMSISLDGFVAGPNQSRENPLGIGGLRLHRWHLDDPIHEADESTMRALLTPCGAVVMGRNMFGPIRGDWSEDWRGWWRVAGGASTARQALEAGVVDELTLDVAPVLLGAGERLFDGVDDPGLVPVEAIHSPKATHIRYRVGGS
jgi:dihydrofolate reductase